MQEDRCMCGNHELVVFADPIFFGFNLENRPIILEHLFVVSYKGLNQPKLINRAFVLVFCKIPVPSCRCPESWGKLTYYKDR